MQVVGSEDVGNASGRFAGVGTLRFSDHCSIRYSAGNEIVPADASLGETWIIGRSPAGYDQRSKSTLEEGVCMVEASAIDRRRMAGILRCTEYDDGICVTRFIATCLAADEPVDRHDP